MKKNLKIAGLVTATLAFLTACGQGDVTSQSTSVWEQIVYAFAKAIQSMSLGGSTGLGIIIFTLLLRIILMPLFNMQIKSGQKMQELQPELKALQAKYPGKDTDSRMLLAEESQKLYQKYDVNPYASLLPLLIQLPILWALFQALTRVPFLQTGTFLWTELSRPDHYFILPLLAAIFTFLSTWLTNKAAKEQNIVMTMMTYLMPIMIFVFGFSMASGAVLYWAVSNAFQVFQIMLLNNPFKIIEERNRKAMEEKERELKIRRAQKKAHKRRK